jgi:hypothetical protein
MSLKSRYVRQRPRAPLPPLTRRHPDYLLPRPPSFVPPRPPAATHPATMTLFNHIS